MENVIFNSEQLKYTASKLAFLFDFGVFLYAGGQIINFSENIEDNAIQNSANLREILLKRAKSQDVPVIYKDSYGVCFCCIKSGDVYFLLGPFCLEKLNNVDLRKYYRNYNNHIGSKKKLPIFNFTKVLSLMELFTELILQIRYNDEELVNANNLMSLKHEDKLRELLLLEIKEEEEEFYHHTYQEEQRLLDCIREGRTQDALVYSKNIDEYVGRLSASELNHRRNEAIVSITLCTRAAIEGRVTPATAYHLSDYYIRKCDESSDIVAITEYRNQAIIELTERVRQCLKGYRGSSYVEQCKDYIRKHYREKIYLKKVADDMGISQSYLSRLFLKETGVNFQEYIMKYRIEKAANLLIHSEKSFSEIGEYVNMSSQSYFGAVFKKYMGVSPKVYRDKNKPREFIKK